VTSYANQTLFDENLTSQSTDAVSRASPGSPGRSGSSAHDSADPDEFDLPDGLRDVDSPLPDNWEGPRVSPDEPDEEKVREAEFFPGADQVTTKEPPRDGAAPAALPFGTKVSVPAQATTLWPGAIGNAERVSPNLIATRAAEIQAMGQLKPCRGRIAEDGHVQIVVGMLDWLAVRHIASQAGEPWTVLVDVEEMDDQRAFLIAYAEAATGVPIAPIDRARWAKEAIRTFGSQRKLAGALGIDESNVTRLVQVWKAVAALSHVIIDEWSVSRNQAVRFVQLLEGERRTEVKAFLKTLPVATAAKTFRAIFERFDQKSAARAGGVQIVGMDGQSVGHARRTGAGDVVVQLTKQAGAIELPALTRYIEVALGQLRANAA
jgi:ParB-like chromosome segregation protein Spo0J